MTTALSATEHLVDRASTKAREQGSGEERKEISDNMMIKRATVWGIREKGEEGQQKEEKEEKEDGEEEKEEQKEEEEEKDNQSRHQE